MSPRDQPEADLGTMSFGDHLQELRVRVFKAVVVPLPLAIVFFLVAPHIRGILIAPLFAALRANGQTIQIQALSPAETIATDMKLAIIAALCVGAPWILFQLWKFIEPGLYKHERRYVYFLVPLSSILTLLGIALFYWVLLPFTLLFLVAFGASQPRKVPIPETKPLVAETSDPATTPTTTSTTSPTASPGTSTPAAANENSSGSAEVAENEKQAEPRESPATFPILDEDPPNPKPGDAWISATDQVLRVAVPLRPQAPNALVEITQDLSAQISAPEDDGIPKSSILEIPLTVLGGISQQYRLSEYISFTLMLLLGSVVAFQMPVVILLLGWVGIISPKFLREKRRWALLIMAIVAAIVTPPDVVSMLLLLGPLWALYEFGILLLVVVPAHKVAAGRVFSVRAARSETAEAAQTEPWEADGSESREDNLQRGARRDDDGSAGSGSS